MELFDLSAIWSVGWEGSLVVELCRWKQIGQAFRIFETEVNPSLMLLATLPTFPDDPSPTACGWLKTRFQSVGKFASFPRFALAFLFEETERERGKATSDYLTPIGTIAPTLLAEPACLSTCDSCIGLRVWRTEIWAYYSIPDFKGLVLSPISFPDILESISKIWYCYCSQREPPLMLPLLGNAWFDHFCLNKHGSRSTMCYLLDTFHAAACCCMRLHAAACGYMLLHTSLEVFL